MDNIISKDNIKLYNYEVPAILGLNTFRASHNVWERLTKNEPYLSEYMEEYNNAVTKFMVNYFLQEQNATLLKSEEYCINKNKPYLSGKPDNIVRLEDGTEAVLICKSIVDKPRSLIDDISTKRDKIYISGYVEAQWQMQLAQLNTALIIYNNYFHAKVYKIKKSNGVIEYINNKIDYFIETYVLTEHFVPYLYTIPIMDVYEVKDKYSLRKYEQIYENIITLQIKKIIDNKPFATEYCNLL